MSEAKERREVCAWKTTETTAVVPNPQVTMETGTIGRTLIPFPSLSLTFIRQSVQFSLLFSRIPLGNSNCYYFLYNFFKLFFFACMGILAGYISGHRIPWNCGYKWLETVLWVLGLKPRHSGTMIIAPNHGSISSLVLEGSVPVTILTMDPQFQPALTASSEVSILILKIQNLVYRVVKSLTQVCTAKGLVQETFDSQHPTFPSLSSQPHLRHLPFQVDT